MTQNPPPAPVLRGAPATNGHLSGAPMHVRGTTAFPIGQELLRNPTLNKGTAFTEEERDALGLRGLLPARVDTQDLQVLRVMDNVRSKTTDLEQYNYLIGLQDRNQTLFYRVLMDNLTELMPIIYTPTIGLACQEYGHIFRRSRGIYISDRDRGSIAKVLANWPVDDVRVIVVTDGERILGLGDLGANGMGIPVGKFSLYTACAGVAPSLCLPVMLDVGTDNQALLDDPLYLGLPHRRLRGAEYDAFFDEFMVAVRDRFPGVLVQLEDFGNANAFRLLEKYEDNACVFNDDIQGTAAVSLAGLYSAIRAIGGRLSDQTIVLYGAGEAAAGICGLISHAMQHEGLSESDARARLWMMDSKGLVVKSRSGLAHHKLPYAHDHAPLLDLLSVVKDLKPTAIVGASSQTGAFTPEVIQIMAANNDRPIIFSLSNPTSQSECTAEEAYTHSNGKAVFASGSPFPNVTYDGQVLHPGQANNAYIFPGVGLGTIVSRAKHVTKEMFYVAARTLADEVCDADLALGRIFPSLERIREVSLKIAIAVARVAFDTGLATIPEPEDLGSTIAAAVYKPEYHSYV